MPDTDIVQTALQTALALVKAHLERAAEQRRQTARACISYLEAAREAIRGLEKEVDEIFVEAMVIGRFESDADHERQLFKRVHSYLNVDRLRPLLSEALNGIDQCHDELVQQANGFFGTNGPRAEAGKAVLNMLAALQEYLSNLRGSLTYSLDNFMGPSGVNMKELKELSDALASDMNVEEAERRDRIAEIADRGSSQRRRDGIALAAAVEHVRRRLQSVYGIDSAASSPKQ